MHNSDTDNKMVERLRSLAADLYSLEPSPIFPDAIKILITVREDDTPDLRSKVTKVSEYTILYNRSAKHVENTGGDDKIRYEYVSQYANIGSPQEPAIHRSFMYWFLYDGISKFDVMCVYTNSVSASIVLVEVISMYTSNIDYCNELLALDERY